MKQCTSAICLPIQLQARPRSHIIDSVDRVLTGMQRYHVDKGILRARYSHANSIPIRSNGHSQAAASLPYNSFNICNFRERTFSTLRRLLTYLRDTGWMTQN